MDEERGVKRGERGGEEAEELGPGEVTFAQGGVDGQVTGPLELLWNGPKGPKLWVADRPVPVYFPGR